MHGSLCGARLSRLFRDEQKSEPIVEDKGSGPIGDEGLKRSRDHCEVYY